tara:strand:- start:4 stop:543 length:540 start_codon:yes stop_codon:yes gene_type:complete
MTKKLILLRHAKSYWGENGRFQYKGDDHDRPLNERGRKTKKLMSQYFLDKNISVDFIFSSTAKRATETLLPFKNKLISHFGYETNKKLYTFNYYDLLTFTKRINDKYQKVMLISHNPGIQDFCLEYVINKQNNPDFEKLKQKFPTCAVAILLANTKNWSSIDKKGFELKKFIIPKSISD